MRTQEAFSKVVADAFEHLAQLQLDYTILNSEDKLTDKGHEYFMQKMSEVNLALYWARRNQPAGKELPAPVGMDKLEAIFDEQRKLNLKLGVQPDTNNPEQVSHWLQQFTRAMQQECGELIDSTIWKWWAKNQKLDLQNARVEIVDILHFLVSAAMAAGLSAEDLFKLYMKKNQVNHDRQKPGYDREKEPDNALVALPVGAGNGAPANVCARESDQ